MMPMVSPTRPSGDEDGAEEVDPAGDGRIGGLGDVAGGHDDDHERRRGG